MYSFAHFVIRRWYLGVEKRRIKENCLAFEMWSSQNLIRIRRQQKVTNDSNRLQLKLWWTLFDIKTNIVWASICRIWDNWLTIWLEFGAEEEGSQSDEWTLSLSRLVWIWTLKYRQCGETLKIAIVGEDLYWSVLITRQPRDKVIGMMHYCLLYSI